MNKLRKTLAERPLSLPLCMLAVVVLLVVGTIVDPTTGIILAAWLCIAAMLFAGSFDL